ncbi:hypothetical protein HUS70_17020 [Pandoraea nosoerga]|uniref:hypothetical protein n=1 Tax=Pandoraea nosoerga TaxID=2508296 RepID=UPI0019808D0B|nr:hypothetical protein [Pandoraea nosoerga]MBN4667194.1 hypothetical protein [Pandoraea nosoerga]MBN4677181.1 hypothetical protein [Pandoraea nosoerga]MBN4681998.1 hypothetical protein [Pandoraea nosoerga]MBN4746316.1 hypothetical protein [Pandoraea nosoerga]
MSEQNFTGDVGQVAAGDAVHHTYGPSQSNVITIHSAAQPEPPAPITEFQRKAIAAKVDQVAKLGGVEKIDVYRIVLTEFGVNRIRELPKADYRATMDMLDGLEKNVNEAPSDAESSEDVEPVSAPGSAIHIHPAPCQGCVGLSDQLKASARHTSVARRWAVAMAFSAVAVSVVLGTGLATGRLEAKGISDGAMRCHFEGRTYSPGSVITIPASTVRECLPDANGRGAHWANVGPATKRR